MNPNSALEPASKTANSSRPLFFIAFGLLCAAFAIMLFYRGFSDPSEGRYAEVPREMVANGNWLEMRLFGYYYYEKPPLAYWSVAPALAALGAHDWAARVPLLVVAICVLALFYILTRKFWSKRLASLSLLIAASTAGFIGGVCMLLTDPFLTLWFSITCVFLLFGFCPDSSHRRRTLFLMLAALAAFLGFMTKGAVAIVLPGAILLLWLLWERRATDLLTPGIPAAAVLFLVLLVPTLWLLERHNPGFFQWFIYEEHLARFTGTRSSQLHAEPAWFYSYILPAMLLPLTFFAFRAIRTIRVKRILSFGGRRDCPESGDTLSRFLAVWGLVVIAFFSASRGKMMSYILPTILPIAILIARWGVLEPRSENKSDSLLWQLGAIGSAIPAIGFFGAWTASYFQLIPGDQYRITGISVLALLPAALCLGAAIWKRRLKTPQGFALFASGTLLSLALLMSPLAGRDFNVRLHNNFSYTYKELAAILEPDDRVVVLWDYRPSLAFYCRRPTLQFQERNELEYGINAELEKSGCYLDTIEELKELTRTSPGRVFAVVEPKYIEWRFKPMGVLHAPTPIGGDPETIILQLLASEE